VNGSSSGRPNGERSILVGDQSSDFVPGDTPTIYAGSVNANQAAQPNKDHKRKSFFGFQLPQLPVDLK
jgi:hypothetical protein